MDAEEMIQIGASDGGLAGREVIAEGKVVVFTDGACRDNQVRTLRQAGIGGFWGEGHPLNFGLPLREGEQTNNRAELAAIIRVLELERRPVNIRTDSKYVLDGVLQHRFRWKRSGWRGKRRPIANADLWIALDTILQTRPPDDICWT
jgi:ribonuclease HI